MYSYGILSTNEKKELSFLYENRAQCFLALGYPIYALGDTYINCEEFDINNVKRTMATAYFQLKDYPNSKMCFQNFF